MIFDKTLEGVVWRRKSHFILASLLRFGEILKYCEIQKILLQSCKEGSGIKQQSDELCKKFMYLPAYHPYRLSLTETIKHLKNVATLTFDALNTQQSGFEIEFPIPLYSILLIVVTCNPSIWRPP
jgi:hypothetical protein